MREFIEDFLGGRLGYFASCGIKDYIAGINAFLKNKLFNYCFIRFIS